MSATPQSMRSNPTTRGGPLCNPIRGPVPSPFDSDGTGGSAVRSNAYILSLGATRTDEFPVYGKLPGGQNVSAGAYSDTIVATVIY